MALTDVLARIPGLAGYQAQRALNDERTMGEFKQAATAMSLMDMVRKQQQEEALRQAIAGAASPEAAIPMLIRQGPQGVKLAGILAEATKDLRNPQRKQTIVPAGATVLGEDNKPLFTAPTKEANQPEIVRLAEMRDKLPQGHPMRGAIDARITKLTTQPSGVTVNMPQSSDLMQKPDGTYVRVRIGKDGRVEEVPLGNVRPPKTAAELKAEGEATEDAATVESVRKRVSRMAALVQGGAMAGGVVGPQGLISRIGETAAGVVQPNAPTPAIDFKNEQALLLADVRKMVEKDPNLSKDERERLYETLGGGIMQTPASSIRTLNNVLNYIESKKLTGRGRAVGLESAVRAAGWDYEPDKYEYRVMDGQVQRKAKGR